MSGVAGLVDDIERALAACKDSIILDRMQWAKRQKDITIALIRLFAEKETFVADTSPEAFE
ncbi:hypothetical protein ACFL1X_14930, partial [Candidatus Hydrogenedentota bacterium]